MWHTHQHHTCAHTPQATANAQLCLLLHILLRCSKALPLAPPGTYCRAHPGRTHVSINFDSKLRHVRLVGLWAQGSRGKERLTRCCSPRARARPLCSRKVPCTAPVAPAHCDSPSMPPVQFSMPPPLNGHPQLTRASTPLCAVSRRSWGRWSSMDQVRIRGGVKDKVRAARMPRAHASIPALCPRYFSTRPHTSRKPPLSCSVPPTLTRCRSRRRRFGARFKRDSN